MGIKTGLGKIYAEQSVGVRAVLSDAKQDRDGRAPQIRIARRPGLKEVARRDLRHVDVPVFPIVQVGNPKKFGHQSLGRLWNLGQLFTGAKSCRLKVLDLPTMLSFLVAAASVNYSVAYGGCLIALVPNVESANLGPGEICSRTDGMTGVAGAPVRQGQRGAAYPGFGQRQSLAATVNERTLLFVRVFIASFTPQLLALVTSLIIQVITTRCLCVTGWAQRTQQAWRMCLLRR